MAAFAAMTEALSVGMSDVYLASGAPPSRFSTTSVWALDIGGRLASSSIVVTPAAHAR